MIKSVNRVASSEIISINLLIFACGRVCAEKEMVGVSLACFVATMVDGWIYELCCLVLRIFGSTFLFLRYNLCRERNGASVASHQLRALDYSVQIFSICVWTSLR